MFYFFIFSIIIIILHVFNYNITAHLEYNTHVFTKLLGKNAIYYYAIYLICSALLRDHVIHLCLLEDKNSMIYYFVILNEFNFEIIGYFLFIFGILLNLWTLKVLGFKGMYNGDSFGFLFDEPVTSGPFKYFSDPQYIGTTIAMLGSALYYKSILGIVLAIIMGIVFYISVKFIEEPHMKKIYSNKKKILKFSIMKYY